MKGQKKLRTVTLLLINLTAILAASVTVFSVQAACWLCCLWDCPGGSARMVRLIQKKSLARCSFTSCDEVS